MNTFTKIEFPTEKIIFKNYIIADVFEIYSRDNFHDFLISAEINQHINIITKKNRHYWQQNSEVISHM